MQHKPDESIFSPIKFGNNSFRLRNSASVVPKHSMMDVILIHSVSEYELGDGDAPESIPQIESIERVRRN